MLAPRASVTLALARVVNDPRYEPVALEAVLHVLEQDVSVSVKREAVRVAQLALGDVGHAGRRHPVFDGYTAGVDLEKRKLELDPVRRRVADLLPTKNADLDHELTRLVAMLRPADGPLLERLLGRITSDSDPVEDIHVLITVACMGVERSEEQTALIARGLVELEPKIVRRQLRQDTNWDDRIGELYTTLVELDPRLPAAIIRQENFGRPGHVAYVKRVSKKDLQVAINAFARQVQRDADYPWSSAVVMVLGESEDPAHRRLIREQFEDYGVRDAVLQILGDDSRKEDRPLFLEGLDSGRIETLQACIEGLEEQAALGTVDEHVAMFKALRRLGTDAREYAVRQRVVRLLQRSTGEEFGFVFGNDGFRPQPEVVDRWAKWLVKKHGAGIASQLGTGGDQLASLRARLMEVDWESGDAGRGKELYRTRGCVQCHGNRRALGPDLVGAAKRFSREDLFVAIALPNRDVFAPLPDDPDRDQGRQGLQRPDRVRLGRWCGVA